MLILAPVLVAENIIEHQLHLEFIKSVKDAGSTSETGTQKPYVLITFHDGSTVKAQMAWADWKQYTVEAQIAYTYEIATLT